MFTKLLTPEETETLDIATPLRQQDVEVGPELTKISQRLQQIAGGEFLVSVQELSLSRHAGIQYIVNNLPSVFWLPAVFCA